MCLFRFVPLHFKYTVNKMTSLDVCACVKKLSLRGGHWGLSFANLSLKKSDVLIIAAEEYFKNWIMQQLNGFLISLCLHKCSERTLHINILLLLKQMFVTIFVTSWESTFWDVGKARRENFYVYDWNYHTVVTRL